MYEEAIALTRAERLVGSEVKALYEKVRFHFGDPTDSDLVPFKRAYFELTSTDLPEKAQGLLAVAWRIHGPAITGHLKAIYKASPTTHNLIAALYVVPAQSPPAKEEEDSR
jgi:hypothetical protein